MYRLPKGMRYSTLDERREFYSRDFDIKALKSWMGKRRNTVYALIVGRHTGIYPDKHKDVRNDTVLIDDYRNLSEVRDYVIDYLPEGAYYDRNLYDSLDACMKCGKPRRHCWNCRHFLGQELAFDLDPENVDCPYHGDVERKMRKGQGLSFCKHEFNVVRGQTLRLCDELKENYSMLRIVYSGRGFHIHVMDSDATRMTRRARAKLAAQLDKRYALDEWVTAGGSRLIRLPYSLHGMVSRICLPLEIDKVKDFDPVTDRLVIPRFCRR